MSQNAYENLVNLTLSWDHTHILAFHTQSISAYGEADL